MKKFIFIAFTVAFAACNSNNTTTEKTTTETTYYGEKITDENATSVDELATAMGDKTEIPVKITGTVTDVCQKKGCWMELKTADGKGLRITFKDYGFFMPKDCQGKTAIAEGIAKIEETSVADLQEYAKDAGKTADEIAAITTPTKELVFEASGVILK
jgi:hypothetical protein